MGKKECLSKNAKKPKKGSKNGKKRKKQEKNEYLWAFLLFRNEKVSKKGCLRAKKAQIRPFLDPPKYLITPIQVAQK